MKDTWNPEQYEKFKDERSRPFFDLMSLVKRPAGEKAIDLGCGTGELTAHLHRHLQLQSTIGLDSSEEMLKKARNFSGDGLDFTSGDIQNWSSPNTYDLIFSNAAIQWCGDHPGIFRRIKESLRPGGQIAIQMPMNHVYPTHVLAAEMSAEEPWTSSLQGRIYDQAQRMMAPEDYARLLFELGFEEQDVFVRVYGHVLESREGIVEWVKGTLLTFFKSRLPTTDYETFEKEFRSRLFRRLPDDKPFFYPFQRVFIWGRLPRESRSRPGS